MLGNLSLLLEKGTPWGGTAKIDEHFPPQFGFGLRYYMVQLYHII